MMKNDIEIKFENAMKDIHYRAKKECKYNAERFNQMIDRRGALETARYLISKADGFDGFTNLYIVGRLDLTVEALVLDELYKDLFTKEEIENCRSKLERANYFK